MFTLMKRSNLLLVLSFIGLCVIWFLWLKPEPKTVETSRFKDSKVKEVAFDELKPAKDKVVKPASGGVKVQPKRLVKTPEVQEKPKNDYGIFKKNFKMKLL